MAYQMCTRIHFILWCIL